LNKIEHFSKVSYYNKLADSLIKLLTTKVRKKITPSKTIIGEKSIPPKLTGMNARTRYKAGSVTLWIKRTIGLKGSGLTQDSTALAITIHMNRSKTRSRTFAIAINRYPIIYINIKAFHLICQVIKKIYGKSNIFLKIKSRNIK